MAIKYLGDESTGTPFTVGETRTVLVTSELNDPISGYEGGIIEYTATVLDSEADKMPATFEADLMLDTTVPTKLIDGQAFGETVYSQSTGLLTLVWEVPAYAAEVTTVTLKWEDQII